MLVKYYSILSLAASASASSLCTESICFTVPGSVSTSPVPTTTISKTTTVTVTTKSVVKQTATITPAPVSSTTTVYQTDTATVTTTGNADTFTTVTTVFITETTTEFSTETFTETSTWTIESPVATTTVLPTEGFIPIQSQIATQGYTPAKRNASPELESRQAADSVEDPGTSEALRFASYPAKVTCVTKVKVISTFTSIITGRKTATTTLKPQTSTFTSTSTVLTTTTITQSSASVTITDTSTSTISTSTSSTYTFTYTSTTVTTVPGPTATVYAVCETPQNYLRTVNGEGFSGFTPERDTTYAFNRSLGDPVACCNACQSIGPNCAVGLSNGADGCFFFIQYNAGNPVCDATLSAMSFTTRSVALALEPGTVIFNGNCGRYRYNR